MQQYCCRDLMSGVGLLVGSQVELYNSSARVYRPTQSTDGAYVQQDVDGADVSSRLQKSH